MSSGGVAVEDIAKEFLIFKNTEYELKTVY